jgi:hypothetical protein
MFPFLVDINWLLVGVVGWVHLYVQFGVLSLTK